MSLLRLRPFHRLLSTTQPAFQSQSYLTALYAAWEKDPKSIDASWSEYFQKIETEAPTSTGSGNRANGGTIMPLLGRPEYTEQIKVGINSIGRSEIVDDVQVHEARSMINGEAVSRWMK